MKRAEKRSRTYKRSHRQAKTAADDKKLMHRSERRQAKREAQTAPDEAQTRVKRRYYGWET